MKIQRKGKSLILMLNEGRIDLTNSHILEEKLQELYNKGFKVIALDFSLVSGIDSSGLGKLLLFQKKLKEHGGKLKVINVTNKYIRKLFETIHLYKVIDIEGVPGSE